MWRGGEGRVEGSVGHCLLGGDYFVFGGRSLSPGEGPPCFPNTSPVSATRLGHRWALSVSIPSPSVTRTIRKAGLFTLTFRKGKLTFVCGD